MRLPKLDQAPMDQNFTNFNKLQIFERSVIHVWSQLSIGGAEGQTLVFEDRRDTFVQVVRVESVTNFIGHCGTTRAKFWPSGAKSYDMIIKEQNNMEMRCALGEGSGKVGFCRFPGLNLKTALAPIFRAVRGSSCNL